MSKSYHDNDTMIVDKQKINNYFKKPFIKRDGKVIKLTDEECYRAYKYIKKSMYKDYIMANKDISLLPAEVSNLVSVYLVELCEGFSEFMESHEKECLHNLWEAYISEFYRRFYGL